jgi:hypothetical protein
VNKAVLVVSKLDLKLDLNKINELTVKLGDCLGPGARRRQRSVGLQFKSRLGKKFVRSYLKKQSYKMAVSGARCRP